MSRSTRVPESRYRDLVCLAYLILDDGSTDGRELAAHAHRVVWQTMAGRRPVGDEASYPILRRRLLTRVLRDEPRAGRLDRWFARLTQPRMPRWLGLSAMPVWRDDGPRGSGRDGRAMVALAAIDGLTIKQARGVITAAFDGRDDLPSETADDQPVLGAEQLRQVLAGFDAALLRAGPGPLTRAGRRRRVTFAAVTAVCVVAVYAAGTTAWNDSRHPGDPTVTSLGFWRSHKLTRSVRDWPAEGDLTGDWPLLRAAEAAYRAGERLDPADSVYVLFAGDLSGTGPLVVLSTDNVTENPVDSYQPGARVPLAHLGTFTDVDGNAPYLVPLPGNRLLVPPWRTDLSMAWLNGAGAKLTWQPLTVHDGIATEVISRQTPACFATLAAVRYRDTSYTGSVVVAPAGNFGQLPWPAVVTLNGDPQNVPLSVFGTLGDLTCEDGAADNWLYDNGYELDITEYGHATLPGAGLVTAVSFLAEDATLRTALLAQDTVLDGTQAEFVTGTGTLATGASSPGPGLTATWWKGPDDTWYLLAAGAGDLHGFFAGGRLRVVYSSGTFTVFTSPASTPAKTGPVVVTVPGSQEVTAFPPG